LAKEIKLSAWGSQFEHTLYQIMATYKPMYMHVYEIYMYVKGGGCVGVWEGDGEWTKKCISLLPLNGQQSRPCQRMLIRRLNF